MPRAACKWPRYGTRGTTRASSSGQPDDPKFRSGFSLWRESRTQRAMQEEKVHVRLLIVAGVALLWMTAVFGRLGYLQLVQHSEYFARAHRQQQRTIEITPK